MKRSDKKLLEDIVEAIGQIEVFIKGFDRANFLKNNLVKSAVLLQFEIIGEAVNHLSEDLREENPEIEWDKIVGFRNQIIHGYFQVDYKLVWDTAEKNLLKLKKQTNRILAELSKK